MRAVKIVAGVLMILTALGLAHAAARSDTTGRFFRHRRRVSKGLTDIDIAVDKAASTLISKQSLPDGYTLRRAIESDCQSILDMIIELAVYEKEPESVLVTVDTLKKDGFGKEKYFYGFIAEDEDGNPVGFALFYIAYSTWEGRCVYLEDLYVRPAHRRAGLGGAVLEGLARVARELDCARLVWQALDWNAPAHNFYEKIGALKHPEWLTYRMYRREIGAFLSSAEGQGGGVQ